MAVRLHACTLLAVLTATQRTLISYRTTILADFLHSCMTTYKGRMHACFAITTPMHPDGRQGGVRSLDAIDPARGSI